MKPFLLLVWAQSGEIAKETPEMRQKGIQAITTYMDKLAEKGQLESASPVDFVGKIVTSEEVVDGPKVIDGYMIAGYFLVKANSLDDAVEITKTNPLVYQHFIEVRPVMTLEID